MAATAVDKELDTAAALLRPDSFGRFGRFGGKYVPETLMAALTELEAAFESLATDHEFQVLLLSSGFISFLIERLNFGENVGCLYLGFGMDCDGVLENRDFNNFHD